MGTGWAGEGRWYRGRISLTAKKFDGEKPFRTKRTKKSEDIGIMLSLIANMKAALNRIPFYRRIYSPGRQR